MSDNENTGAEWECHLLMAFQRFYAARTWEDSRRILQNVPGLLDDRVTEFARQFAEAVRVQHGSTFARSVEEHIQVLERCRNSDVAAVFASLPKGKGRGVDFPSEVESDVLRATELKRQYESIGNTACLDEAAAIWESVFSHNAFGRADADARLAAGNNFATVLWSRFGRTGNRDDLDRAVELLMGSPTFATVESSLTAQVNNNLCMVLQDRGRHFGCTDDLVAAIAAGETAVAAVVPPRPDFLTNLGNALFQRFSTTGDREDLNRAISLQEESVACSTEDAPGLAGRLNNLSNGLRERFRLTSDPEDIRRCVEVCRKAVELTPASAPDFPMFINNLGNALWCRYGRYGNSGNLNESIVCFESAVAGTADSTPDRHRRFNNLGNALRDRFKRHGDLTDLELAIRNWNLALNGLPPDSGERPAILNNLASGLSLQFNYSHDLGTLNRAISAWQQAVDVRGIATADGPNRLNNLANGLEKRFAVTGEPGALERAIELYQQAADAIPDHAPAAPKVKNNYGNALSTRYLATGDSTDLLQAIRLWREAVEQTEPGSPDYPSMLRNLAIGLARLHGRNATKAQQIEIARAFLACIESSQETDAEVALDCSVDWANWAFENENWHSVCDANERGFEAVCRLVERQPFRSGRQTWLRRVQGLSQRAALACVRLGRETEALQVLERSRAVLLSTALEEHSSQVDELRRSNEQLHNVYRTAIDEAGHWDRFDLREENAMRTAESLAAARASRQRLQSVLAAIRCLPDFGSFLRIDHPDEPASIVSSMSARSALVYLVETEVASCAVIARREGICSLSLEEQTERRTGRQGENDRSAGLRQTITSGRIKDLPAALESDLTRLGESVIAPVAKCLRESDVEHVVLIPCGTLTLLPLHAAPYQVNETRYTLLDEFEVSYVPNARTLTRQVRPAHSGLTELFLGVGHPTETESPLPCSEWELLGIAEQFTDARSMTLSGSDATRKQVLPQLGRAFLHFATHATFRRDEPLKSELVLSNGDSLSLRDLIDGTAGIVDARLVVLSACQTAVNDTDCLPDECVGFPASLLQCGVRSVVGTLWPVNDVSTSIFMVRFYQCLVVKGLPVGKAFREAQRWLKHVSFEDVLDWLSVDPASVWQQRLHDEFILRYGLSDDGPVFSASHWAPFVLFGEV